MTQSTAIDTQNQQSVRAPQADAAKNRAGVAGKSSNEHMSRQKAGNDEGAGGGAKQAQKH